MIEIHLLEVLVTFARYGTLAKAAEVLGLTQPALTHSLKSLEDQLGVQLFIRKPNRLILTESGQYAVQEAQKILKLDTQFTDKVRHFEQSNTTITVGANAPGPLIVVNSLAAPNISVKEVHVQQGFENILNEEQVTCLLTNRDLHDQHITSIYLGTERMGINLPPDTSLIDLPELKFADLAGRTFLCPQEIGFWQSIYESHIPNGRFIYQDESSEYQALLQYSSLPFFTTNLTRLDPHWGTGLPDNRIFKPLADDVAQQPFYMNFLKRNQMRLTPFIERVQDQWAQAD
ncbi:transcriptional regulator, LysR-family [Lactiplantibacillus pentosus KCA1]|nr:LysR family transcriptional regulator [Lactiplantibacillus pentosus]EIW14196.1 transcriptional regulator, LysR-family [Lactiplantibacillus pentosus KCA1]